MLASKIYNKIRNTSFISGWKVWMKSHFCYGANQQYIESTLELNGETFFVLREHQIKAIAENAYCAGATEIFMHDGGYDSEPARLCLMFDEDQSGSFKIMLHFFPDLDIKASAAQIKNAWEKEEGLLWIDIDVYKAQASN